MMTTSEKPARPWRMQDLQSLGRRGKKTYLKAVPVLILEKWVRGDGKEGIANYIEHSEVNDRLVSSGLRVPFKPKAVGSTLGSLVRMQSEKSGRNLTAPPLIESREAGTSWINLPHYERLLQEYCKWYRKQYPGDYRRLFPDREPDWGSVSDKPTTEDEESLDFTPSIHINVQVHISPEASPDQIDQIFASMARHFRQLMASDE
jgi:hypothetical protein